jgi:hypothetical protein
MYDAYFKGIQKIRTFGKMYVMTTKKAIQETLIDKGTVGLFVGYPEKHANDVYRIFNLKTKQVIKSRDLIWLNLNFGNWI